MDFLYSLISFFVWWAPLFILLYVLYASSFLQAAWKRCKNTYHSLGALKNLVATQHKNPARVILVTVFTALKTCGSIIFKICWINFLQYLNNTVVREGRFFCVTYVIKGKLYKIKVLPPRGPEKIMLISDDSYNDATGDIGPYLDAQRTIIHHFTPKDFGKENIQIITTDEDDPYNFNEDEKIVFNNETIIESLSNPPSARHSRENSTLFGAPPPEMENLMENLMGMLSGLAQNMRPDQQISQKTE